MITNIVISIGMIMIFLGIFFFGYAAKVEQEIIKLNTEIITTDILNIILPSLDTNTKLNLLKDIKYPDMSKEDSDVAEANTVLINNAIMLLVIIFIVSLIIGFALSYYYNHKFLHILGINLIILFFVGLTEYSFINIIAAKYISADTNYVRYCTLIKLKDKFMIGN